MEEIIEVDIIEEVIEVDVTEQVIEIDIVAQGAQGLPGAIGDPGADGENGLSVELQNTGTYIQWRQIGGEWQNIIAIADLIPEVGSIATYDIWTGTQAEYDALGAWDSETLYLTTD